jgi:CRISPR-associated protein Cas2
MSIYVVVCYDVKTSDDGGPKRLRRVADVCESFGVRVQYSVFECKLTDAQWVEFRERLVREVEEESDSLRFYFLDKASFDKREHYGAGVPVDPSGVLIV